MPHQPAVHADHLPGDVRGRVGTQERHHLGHLHRGAEPSDGHVAKVYLARGLGNRRGHVGGDEAGHHRIDEHTLRRQLA